MWNIDHAFICQRPLSFFVDNLYHMVAEQHSGLEFYALFTQRLDIVPLLSSQDLQTFISLRNHKIGDVASDPVAYRLHGRYREQDLIDAIANNQLDIVAVLTRCPTLFNHHTMKYASDEILDVVVQYLPDCMLSYSWMGRHVIKMYSRFPFNRTIERAVAKLGN